MLLSGKAALLPRRNGDSPSLGSPAGDVFEAGSSMPSLLMRRLKVLSFGIAVGTLGLIQNIIRDWGPLLTDKCPRRASEARVGDSALQNIVSFRRTNIPQ